MTIATPTFLVGLLAFVLAGCAGSSQLPASESACAERSRHEVVSAECWPASRELSGVFGR